MPFHHQYRFNLALTASLLLHLFFLFGIAIQVSKTPSVNPGPLHATLLSLDKQGVASTQGSVLPEPEVIEKQPVIQKKKQKTERRILPNDNNQARPLPDKTPSQTQPTRTQEHESTQPSVQAKKATGGSIASENNETSAGLTLAGANNPGGDVSTAKGNANPAEEARKRLDQQEVQQYRWHLGKAIKRFKRYPALARERGWEGNAEFSIDFAAMRHVPQIILKRSSGRELLDTQALEMIRQAINVTLLPENLRGHNFHIPLTVEFRLEEAS